MKRFFIAAILAGVATTTAHAATQETLSGAELRKAVAGKTVYLSSSGIVLPISYRSNGTMRGQLKAFAAALVGGQPVDSGRWWIANDQLCQKWKRWLDGKSYCYKLTRNGQNVVWVRNDGRSGAARIGG
jgi:hypothetical protein